MGGGGAVHSQYLKIKPLSQNENANPVLKNLMFISLRFPSQI